MGLTPDAECPACCGSGERFYRVSWLDPQTEASDPCVTCEGTGMNRDFVQYETTYDEYVQRYSRDNTAPDGFDAEFDELLARQDRLDEYGRQVTSGTQARVTVIKGAGGLEAGPSPDSSERKAA